MPSNRSNKQYKAASAANTQFPQGSSRVAPATDNRISLRLQNTGANPGLVHFKEAVQNDGSDFLVAAGAFLNFDQADTCPTEAINVGSVLGTTWAVLEGTAKS